METSNIVSINLTEEIKAELSEKFSAFQSALKPYLTALSPKQKKTLTKMGDLSYAFVTSADDYLTSHPEYAPNFMDAPEMHKDVDIIRFFTQLLQSLNTIQNDLEDTITLAGSEAYTAARTYYNSVTYAAGIGKLSAKAIAEDLSQQYPGRNKGKGQTKKGSNSNKQ